MQSGDKKAAGAAAATVAAAGISAAIVSRPTREGTYTMVFKIEAADQKRIEAAFGQLTARRSTLEESVRVFNEAVAAARATLQLDVNAYNEKVDAARGVLDDVHRELEDEFDDKSANWQNGDKGIATKEWIDTIGALAEELTEAALDVFPESLEFEDVIGEDPADGYTELDKEAPSAE
jgi:hypothetical protein